MPRTRRTPASQTPAAEDAAQVETPMVAADAPSSENAVTPEAAALTSSNTQDTPAKTPRRRAPRKPKAETAEPEAAAQAPEAPTTEDAAAPRRRGRRTASLSAAQNTPAEAVPDLEALVVAETREETPEAPRRRRGRQTGASETPTETSTASSVEPPAPAPRRRGRRTGTDTPSAETTAAPPSTPAVVPSRRRGQARATPPPVVQAQVVEAPVIEEPTPQITAEVVEESAPAGASSTRRRGRRRGAAVSEAPPSLDLAPLELPDVEAPVDPSVSGEEPEDGDKRGRRSRRSRRRRGGNDEPTTEMLEAAGSTLILPEEVIEVETPEEDEDDTLLAYPPPAPPVYSAPRIVPPVLPPADETQGPRLTAAVTHEGRGLARISVNGTHHSPYFFFVNADTAPDGETVEAQIRQAAANGIHLFSGVMYLPLRNAYGDRSFGAIDALVQQILTADPDGYVLPRLQFFPTNYWARTHSDQSARYADGEEGDVSLASTDFWADCVDALEALIAHFADPSTPGGDRVLGFHLDRGEWFTDAAAGYDLSLPNQIAFQNWLHAKYQALHALRAAWHDADLTWEDAAVPDWPGQTAPVKKTDTQIYSTRREGRWPDYAQYASELAAGVIAGLAEAIKTLSLGRLIVAASYGYTLEFAGRNDSGHLALGKLLQSPHIDIVAGPNSYAGRSAGSPAAFSAPLDSVALHGKLWLVEDDTKTFLAEAETEDTYNPKIVSGADTQAIHQRHFGAALAHRAGVTWMDLWGQGWLNSPDIWRELGGLVTQAGRWEKLVPNTPTTPDVAVLVDEASLRYLKNDANGLGTHLISRTRDLLLRAGGSVGFYLQSDITRPDFPEAKLYLFLNALRITTEERQAVREKLQRPGKTLAWVFAPGLFDENGPSSEEINEVVGMALRPQPWNSRGGSVATDIKHPITERIRGVKKIGQEEILNPLYAVSDPQATVVAEYAGTGATSLAAREHKGGWKSVFFGDPYLTIELLRGLYAYAGVALYDGQDDIVYASGDGALTVHGPFTGQRTITLPRKASVYDVFDNNIIATNTRSFRAFVRARTTRLFLWGDGRALAAATGLDLPAQSAEVTEEAVQTPPLVSAPPRSSRELRAEEEADSVLPTAAPVPSRELQTVRETLAVTLPDETDDEDADGLEGSDSADESAESNDPNAPTRRSRWQRRRAAARARRDADRLAKQTAGDSTTDPDTASTPPVDMATLLPGLPPRRTPTPRVEAPLAADRIAGILAIDTSEDDTQDIPDAVALTLSDVALTDMADDFGDAETEAAGEE